VLSLRVGIVSVTYRGGDRPQAWARALRQAIDDAAEADVLVQVVAVDNASGDGTARRLTDAAPWVDVVELPSNVGFAAGCNAGVRRLESPDLVILLNPDVQLARSFLRVLATLPWPADVAARGPLIYELGGGVEQSARGFPRAATAVLGRTSLLARMNPRGRAISRELRADPDAGTTSADWVSGACLVTTRAVLGEVGELDEGYFMYWEDADWCRRAADRGLRVLYEPSLVARHDQGASSSSRRAATTVAFHRSALRYWRRHLARSSLSTVMAATALSLRCAIKLVVLGVHSLARAWPRARNEG